MKFITYMPCWTSVIEVGDLRNAICHVHLLQTHEHRGWAIVILLILWFANKRSCTVYRFISYRC